MIFEMDRKYLRKNNRSPRAIACRDPIRNEQLGLAQAESGAIQLATFVTGRQQEEWFSNLLTNYLAAL